MKKCPVRSDPGTHRLMLKMTSLAPFKPLPPTRAQAGMTALASSFAARQETPRLAVFADTHQAAGSQSWPGFSHMIGKIADLVLRIAGRNLQTRARVHGTGPSGSTPPLGAWSNYNDNAHVDRRAPPGRNPGGGAQRQPY
jgi:hypothetical protein